MGRSLRGRGLAVEEEGGRGVATELGGALLGSPTKELLLLAAALPEALGWSAAQLEPAGLSVPTVARALRDSAGRC